MKKLQNLLDSDTREGRIFDLSIQGLIVFSLITFSLETLPNLDTDTQQILSYVEVFIISVFTAEYVIRVALTENRLKYIFSFYGLIDLIAILPFYLSSTVNLQTLRALRLLRLFKLFKLVKYNAAYRRVAKAIVLAKEELVLFTVLTLILLYVAALGIYHFEHAVQPENFRSIFDALWWAVATLTTVGYGDIYPITVGGRIFTFFILMLGLGIVAVPTGIIASALASVKRKETN